MVDSILVARGGALSPYSGLGSTHVALVENLKAGLVDGYSLGEVHEYPLGGGPFTRLWRRWFSGPKAVVSKASKHSIIHISDQEQAGLVPKNGNTPCVVTVHDLFHLFPTKYGDVDIGKQNPSLIRRNDIKNIKAGLLRADLLICISKHTLQECEMRFPGVATAWVPHAIDLKKYQKESEKPSWFNDGKNLLIVGSEEPRKRVGFAIEVCSGMDVTLHKIGAESSPNAKAKLIALAKKKNCDLNWVGTVEQDEMIAALQHADALLFPSVAEGFGLPPLEAMAAGTVALVGDAPAANEIPLPEHILPTDDVEAWQNAINNLSTDSEALQARANEFSTVEWANRLKSAYKSIQ